MKVEEAVHMILGNLEEGDAEGAIERLLHGKYGDVINDHLSARWERIPKCISTQAMQ